MITKFTQYFSNKRPLTKYDSVYFLANLRMFVYLKSELQTTYGILCRSALLSLQDFEITKQLPNDIMHVFLEGILPYECQLSLSALMERHLFILEEFNYQLKRFQFSYANGKSKPEPLKQSVFIAGERQLKVSAENSKISIKIC